MSLSNYQGKKVTIKRTNTDGTITLAKHKRGADSSLGVRFHVTDVNGKSHELHPSDVTILD